MVAPPLVLLLVELLLVEPLLVVLLLVEPLLVVVLLLVVWEPLLVVVVVLLVELLPPVEPLVEAPPSLPLHPAYANAVAPSPNTKTR